MSSVNLDKLGFDPTDIPEGPTIGSYIISDSGEIITHTTDGGKERLDVSADIAGLGNPSEFGIYPEDAAHVSAELGQLILAVRNDTEGSLVDTDGDRGALQLDASGRLRTVTDLDLTGDIPADGEVDATDPLKAGSHAYDQSSVWGAVDAGDIANQAADLYRRQLINDAPNIAGSNEAVSVDTTLGGVALGTASSGRTRMFVQNRGDKAIYWGFGTVTAANGIEIGKNDTMALEMGEALVPKAIAASGTQDVRVAHWG